MRLLHTKKLVFEEFFDSEIPPYAILSHRWQDREVSYREFLKSTKVGSASHSKILNCCSLAASNQLNWVWIDTCCIDKKSSAEVSEAINSMYRWYQLAVECYVYLSDVPHRPHQLKELLREDFRKSKWFTRGWTLQELLAPRSMVFYDSQWTPIGNRAEWEADISDVTGIDHWHIHYAENACVAAKMSWLAKRETSRIEDMAYCMVGLFNVNMPLLYGEGRKAFMRLQHEIIRVSDDETIFAWRSNKISSGMLAEWPTAFKYSGDTERHEEGEQERSPYDITHKGLRLEVPLPAQVPADGRVLLQLNCMRRGDEHPLAIVLEHLGSNSWQRYNCNYLEQNEVEFGSAAMIEQGVATILVRQ